MIGPSLGNGYILMTGTSVAAAHTTGIAAMLLEWGITRSALEHMDGTDVKNMILRGAKRESSRTYPNKEWGYGMLDVYGVFEKLRGNQI